MKPQPNYIASIQMLKQVCISEGIFENDADYREMLLREYTDQFKPDCRIPSITTMSDRAKKHLISYLNALLGRNPKLIYPWIRHTKAQYGRMMGLFNQLNYNQEDVIRFIKKQTGQLKSIEMTSHADAHKIITGLEKIISQRKQN